MANIEVSIKIDMNPTDAGRSPDKMAEQTERGCFRLVLDEAAELDIEALGRWLAPNVLSGAVGCLGAASGTGNKEKP
jgi:hypothetical protein